MCNIVIFSNAYVGCITVWINYGHIFSPELSKVLLLIYINMKDVCAALQNRQNLVLV